MIEQVLLGDCLERMKEISDVSIDMVLADLPYGLTNCAWDTCINLESFWTEIKRIRKDNSPVLLFAQTPFDKVLGMSNIHELKYEWIWVKNKPRGHLNSRRMPMKAHENILVFYKKLPKYNFIKTHGHKPMNYAVNHDKASELYNKATATKNDAGSTERFPTTILNFDVVNNDDPNKTHPTQKPTPLLEYMIKTYTDVGDVVLDTCAGSGSTLIAAKNLGRQFIGIEKEKEYYDIIVERLSGGCISNTDNK